MPGTKVGGQRAAETNKKRHGSDFYAKIGATGGKKGRTGGFYANRELAREAGRKGGLISRRTSVKRVVAEAPKKSDLTLAA
jgi:general stress protein YciG